MKKGISLIVLIITIVVIIILATAIVVNIAQTDMIGNASEAVVKQDFKTMQDELTLYKADKYLEAKGKYDSSTLYADETTNPSIYDIIPSLKNSKYDGKVCIINGNLALSEDITEEQRNWISEVMDFETYVVSELNKDKSYLIQTGGYVMLPENATYAVAQSNSNIVLEGRKVTALNTATTKDLMYLTGTVGEKTYNIGVYITPEIDNNEYVIRTAEDLARVTFFINGQIAKTHNMRLENDIDLSTVCGENIGSWTPIGTESVPYTGTFNGNYYSIKNIYINNNLRYQGLFGFAKHGKISNFKLEGGIIRGELDVAGIVAYIDNTTIENCGNNVEVVASKCYVAGICARGIFPKIYNCYNKGDITSNGYDSYHQSNIAGIIGTLYNNPGKENVGVFNSYNTGKIIASGYVGAGIIGCCDHTENTNKYISNCYNIGEITGTFIASLVGISNQYMKVTNSYWTNDMECFYEHLTYIPTVTNSKQVTLAELKGYATTLGDAYTNDTTNINNGFPILKWELK